MNLMRWTPSGNMNNLQDQLNRLFEATLPGWPLQSDSTHAWAPAADIRETDNELVVALDLPGVDSKEVDIRVENSLLTVRGKREWDAQSEKDNYHRAERLYGTFARSFMLATDVDANKVRAIYKDGVLTISLPKAEKAKPRRIEITTADRSVKAA